MNSQPMNSQPLDIAVIGKPEFTLGFRLTGIRNIVEINDDSDLPDLLSPFFGKKTVGIEKTAGIVIIDEETMNSLDEDSREQVVGSIEPVFVVVGKEASQDELRKMIIQSIGVDLMKEEDEERRGMN